MCSLAVGEVPKTGDGLKVGVNAPVKEPPFQISWIRPWNSKVYAKSPKFSPALGLIIFGKKSVATNLR